MCRIEHPLGCEKSCISVRYMSMIFPPVQTGPGAHPASCKMGTGSIPGVICGRGVLLTTHLLLVPRSWKSTSTHPVGHTGPVTASLYLLHVYGSRTVEVIFMFVWYETFFFWWKLN